MTAQAKFSPVHPIRTNTADSQSSGQLSPLLSPTTPTSRATSPTEQSFFGAITARVRGRSRSRSRNASRNRSKSPVMSPPPRQIATQAQQPRYVAVASPTQSRPTPDRRSTTGSDPWRGRHSNEWLFGGWSATETAKDLLQRRKA